MWQVSHTSLQNENILYSIQINEQYCYSEKKKKKRSSYWDFSSSQICFLGLGTGQLVAYFCVLPAVYCRIKYCTAGLGKSCTAKSGGNYC